MRRVIFAILIGFLDPLSASAAPKKGSNSEPLSIRFSGSGTISIDIFSKALGGPAQCLSDSETIAQDFQNLGWFMTWKNIAPATGSFTATSFTMSAATSSTQKDEADLRSCQNEYGGEIYLGQNGCTPGNDCRTSTSCAGSLTSYGKEYELLSISGIPAGEARHPKKNFSVSFSGTAPVVSDCADEVLTHVFYANSNPPVPKPLDMRLYFSPNSNAHSTILPFKREGMLNCAPPPVKAIEDVNEYDCQLNYVLKGQVIISGPYSGEIRALPPYK